MKMGFGYLVQTVTTVLLLATTSALARSDEVTIYRVPGDKTSPTYEVTVNDQKVFTTRFFGMHYAHIACSGEVVIEVTAPQAIDSYTISPKRWGIRSVVEDRRLRFKIDCIRARYLLIQIDGMENLCILIDPPEQRPPHPGDPTVVDAGQFLTDPTGRTDQSAAFAKAIAAVNGRGKTLYVPPGIYATKVIHLWQCRDCTIYLAPGCLIRSPLNGTWSDGVLVQHCENVKILGRGVIDHQAFQNIYGAEADYDEQPEEMNPHREINGSPMMVMNSRGVTIDGLTVRNSRNWNVDIKESDQVLLRNCKVLSPPACNPEWTDGYNLTSCHDTRIEDSFCYVNDDCFAAGQYYTNTNTREARNCFVSNLVGYNPRGNGVRLGWETDFDQGNFTFEQCDFILPGNNSCLIMHELPGDKRYGTVYFKDCGFERVGEMTGYMINVASPRQGCLTAMGDKGIRMDRLEMINVSFDGQRPIRIKGDPESPIKQLVLRELTVDGKPWNSLVDADIELSYVTEVSIK